MHRQTPTRLQLVVVAFVFLCSNGTASAQHRRYRGQKEYLPYTRNLPHIDRVELFKLKLNREDEWDGGIIASKTLYHARAQKLASLWRRQSYNDRQSACHNPGWAIKFYTRRKLLAYATVCFSCNNISMITPHLATRQNFGGYEPIGEQLEQMFSAAFAEGKTSSLPSVRRRRSTPCWYQSLPPNQYCYRDKQQTSATFRARLQ